MSLIGMDEAAAGRAVVPTLIFTLVIFFIAVVSLQRTYTLEIPVGLRLPPSPSGSRPHSGHAHIWDGKPTSRPPTSQLVKWSREFGEIYQIQVGRERWVIFSSPEAVKEVFDRHGAVTGTRPPLIVANDVLSGGNRVIFMPYGRKWRNLRAIIHQCLNVKSVDVLKPSQDIESRKYLYDILIDPEHFLYHVKRYAVSVIVYATYGFRILSLDHPVLQAIYKGTAKFGEVFGDRFLVDQYPVLEYLPEALQWWRWKIEPYRKEGDRLMLGLWNGLKKQVESGVSTGCFVERFMETDYPKMGITELQAAWVAGSMIEAGSDTTQLLLNSTILGLVSHPEVVTKAHEELDRVVGNRLPEFSDAPRLPYIRAIVKEVLRWRSPSNDYIRHDTTADITYKDYFIPAGSIIVLNLWAIHYDPSIYNDPERFNPGRFVGTRALDLSAGECINASDVAHRDHFAFGAGRRVCPGYNLGENSLFLLTARLLWGFDVQAPIDLTKGERTSYNLWDYPAKRLFGPNPFPVDFKVRSASKERIIREGS